MSGAAFTPGERPSLFTQCAKCETVFRLSAEVLRAAGGQVRCGRCGEVFNALARLAEDASAFPAGESLLEMEERADEILHSTVPPLKQTPTSASDFEELGNNDIEFARLQVLEKFIEDLPPAPVAAATAGTAPAAAAPTAAESPTASALPTSTPSSAASKPAPAKATAAAKPSAAPKPAAPSKIPAANSAAPAAKAGKPPVSPAAPPKTAQAATQRPADDPVLDGETSMEFTLPPGELDRIFIDLAPALRNSTLGQTGASAEHAAQPAETGDPTRNRMDGLEVSDDVRREMLSGIGESSLPDIDLPRRRELPREAWLGAAAMLTLALTVQLIHGNREWVGTHAPLRGLLHGLYSAMGVTLPAPASLSAYQLRQWGVTGQPSAAGTLRVRASILNTAAQLQPYPLLRVTLANRFGSKIGARDFEPAEYMGKPTVRLLAPGERADATLDIVDPGKDAEGFEIDVCLRGVDQRISCAGDAAAQAKQ